MIDFQKAQAQATQKMRDIAGSAANEFAIQHEHTKKTKSGWVFFYNTIQYIETRDPMYMLAGNGPIFVSKEGELAVLPSSKPWQEFVEEL